MRYKDATSGFIACGSMLASVRILLYSSFALKLSLHTPFSDLEVTKVTARSL